MKKSLFSLIGLVFVFAAFMPVSVNAAPKSKSDSPIKITQPEKFKVSEKGDSQRFGLSLRSAPSSKVVLKITSTDPSEGVVDKQELTFLRENWDTIQYVNVTGVDDKAPDGNRKFDVLIDVDYTKDPNFKSAEGRKLTFTCVDDETDEKSSINKVITDLAINGKHTGNTVKLRIMTANTTSGEEQSYDDGEGIRIFKAMKPDIVLIQEFNYNKNSIKSFVASTFGNEYSYYRGSGDIPNGIISKYPIIETGAWKSNRVSDRKWEWAVIDIPGSRDLLAISVHLYTQDNEAEMEPLRKQIEQKLKKDGKDYYIILGGDFNQPDWKPIQNKLGQMFEVGTSYADWPADQDGMVKTNATRHKQLDYLLCNPDFCALETPTIVGEKSYPKGHVVDSRVYEKRGEIQEITPVKPDDSAANKMQHMAVIRDFEYVPM